MRLIPFMLILLLVSCANGNEPQKPPHLKNVKPVNLQFFETYSWADIASSWQNACQWIHEHDTLAAKENLSLAENPGGLGALVHPIDENLMNWYANEEDMSKVDAMLALPEVKKFFPENLQFRWSYGVEKEQSGHKMYALYAIQMPYGNEAKIDGRHIVSANAAKSYDGRPVIRIAMDTKGSHEWKIMTTNNIGKAIAIVINDHVITCPVVTNAITGGETEISGNFTVKEAEELAARIYAGIK